MQNQIFRYSGDRSFYRKRPVPGQPGMNEYMLYVKAQNMPRDVPSGCNPRAQNIDKPTYKAVTESFQSTEDMNFHLKNRGIKVLATRVVEDFDDHNNVILDVVIPEELGDVDGHHSYAIVNKYRDVNPDQCIHVTIQENVPSEIISDVAAGLNTSVQITTASMATHRGYFLSVENALQGQPYADWIAYLQNDEGTPLSTLVKMMWVCNPLLFSEGSRKHPNWIYTRGQSVFENGFYAPNQEALRTQMLKMVPALKRLIAMFSYINDDAQLFLPRKPRAPRAKGDNLGGSRNELGLQDLFQPKIGRPFHDPTDKTKYNQLREPYHMLIFSGLRALLRYDKDAGEVGWIVDEDAARRIVHNGLKKIMQKIIIQLKADKGNHNQTPKQPTLWDLSYSIFNEEFRNVERELTEDPIF